MLQLGRAARSIFNNHSAFRSTVFLSSSMGAPTSRATQPIGPGFWNVIPAPVPNNPPNGNANNSYTYASTMDNALYMIGGYKENFVSILNNTYTLLYKFVNNLFLFSRRPRLANPSINTARRIQNIQKDTTGFYLLTFPKKLENL